MGNGQHEQKVDKLQILNPNCICMVIELNCEIVCWRKAHVINKNIDGFYGKTTQGSIQKALCKN